ncbi:MAG: PT domain-containing protein [Clostridia bacterium]|nr:PT domain-containing protein [Clostridia bacterium]
MKRTAIMIFVLMLVLSSPVPRTLEVCAAEPEQSEAETETEYVRFINQNSDPHAIFDFSENGHHSTIDPDTVKWAAVRHRTAARYNPNNIEYIGQLYITPAKQPYIPLRYVYTGEWETLIVDLTSVAVLPGSESVWDSENYTETQGIRIDPLEPDWDADGYDSSIDRGVVGEGDYVDIAWIAFFEKEEDARAYTGTESTPYCLLDAKSLAAPHAGRHLDHEYINTGASPETPVISGPTALFSFDEEDDVINLLLSGSKKLVSNIRFDDGRYLLDLTEGSDPYLELCFGSLAAFGDIEEIDAGESKVMQLGIRVNTVANGRVGNIYWQTDLHTGFNETKNRDIIYKATEDVQTVNVELFKDKYWEGTLSNLRFDPFPKVIESTTLELYYIAFFANTESADAFAAKYLEGGLAAAVATEPAQTDPDASGDPAYTAAVPTEKQTEVPIAEPTSVPTEASIAEPTIAPTEANTGVDQNSNPGSKKVLLITGIAVCGVIIAAILLLIIIKKKKQMHTSF